MNSKVLLQDAGEARPTTLSILKRLSTQEEISSEDRAELFIIAAELSETTYSGQLYMQDNRFRLENSQTTQENYKALGLAGNLLLKLAAGEITTSEPQIARSTRTASISLFLSIAENLFIRASTSADGFDYVQKTGETYHMNLNIVDPNVQVFLSARGLNSINDAIKSLHIDTLRRSHNSVNNPHLQELLDIMYEPAKFSDLFDLTQQGDFLNKLSARYRVLSNFAGLE